MNIPESLLVLNKLIAMEKYLQQTRNILLFFIWVSIYICPLYHHISREGEDQHLHHIDFTASI